MVTPATNPATSYKLHGSNKVIEADGVKRLSRCMTVELSNKSLYLLSVLFVGHSGSLTGNVAESKCGCNAEIRKDFASSRQLDIASNSVETSCKLPQVK